MSVCSVSAVPECSPFDDDRAGVHGRTCLTAQELRLRAVARGLGYLRQEERALVPAQVRPAPPACRQEKRRSPRRARTAVVGRRAERRLEPPRAAPRSSVNT